MSATNSLETSLLQHLFTNSAIANIGDAGGLQPSASAGSLYIALLTAASDLEVPTVTEANYTGYARKAVARNAAWTVSNNSVINAGAITFDVCTAGSNTVTHFAIYTALTSGTALFVGALTSSLAISSGITPEFAAGQLTVTVD